MDIPVEILQIEQNWPRFARCIARKVLYSTHCARALQKFNVVPGESWFQLQPLKFFFFLQSGDRNRTITIEIAISTVFHVVYVNFRAKRRNPALQNRMSHLHKLCSVVLQISEV